MKDTLRKSNQLNNMFCFILQAIKNDKDISLNDIYLFLTEMNKLSVEIYENCKNNLNAEYILNISHSKGF